MRARGVRRFVADLLAGRRPRSFRAQKADVETLRAAITLRAAQPGSATPREQFVTELHQRLASAQNDNAQTNQDIAPLPRPASAGTRRQWVRGASIAATAATIGAVAEHTLTPHNPAPSSPSGQQTLTPNTGQWHTVSTSTELTDGAVRSFDLGTVIGFVARTDGALRAVSGVCTHLGCRLTLNNPAQRLDCPCHRTSFTLTGQLLRYQLTVPPPPLPQLSVRETQGMVQIYAPPGPVA